YGSVPSRSAGWNQPGGGWVPPASPFWGYDVPDSSAGFRFDVLGSHVFGPPGGVGTSVLDDDGSTAPSHRPATVAAAPGHLIGAVPFVYGTEGQALGNPLLLTFSAGTADGPAPSPQAWVRWGDGSAALAVTPLRLADGTYAVRADHTYAVNGSYRVVVTFGAPVNAPGNLLAAAPAARLPAAHPPPPT